MARLITLINNMFKFRIYQIPTCRLSNSMTTRSALRSEKSPLSSLRGLTHINFPEWWRALQNTPSTSNCLPGSSLLGPPCERTGRIAEIGTNTSFSRFSGFVVCVKEYHYCLNGSKGCDSESHRIESFVSEVLGTFLWDLPKSICVSTWGTFLEIPDTFFGSSKLIF